MAAALVALLAGSASAGTGPAVTFETLLAETTDLARLPRATPGYTSAQASSYDRHSVAPELPGWFANDDRGNFLGVEQHDGRTEYVMIDAAGPGAITRIWTANTAGTLRVYVDGADEPVLSGVTAFLLAGMVSPFGSPLATYSAQGRNWFVPIPYAERCKITIDVPNGFYYHVDYRSYPPGTVVESYHAGTAAASLAAIEQANAVLADPDQVLPAIPPHDVRSGYLRPTSGPAVFAAHLEQGRGSRVRELVLEPSVTDDWTLRHTLLEIRFDGQTTVRAPLGDFFGSGPGLHPYESLPMSVRADGTLVSRWVMPFESEMQIAISGGDEDLVVAYRVALEPWAWEPGTRHFHASWRPDYELHDEGPRDWTVMELTGTGLLAGSVLNVTSPFPLWWGEGDEKIWIDGAPFPDHFGTGTEDYFGYAWGTLEVFARPYHGQTRADGAGGVDHRGRTSLYRWHVSDPIPFAASLRFDLEQLSIANPERRVLFDVVSYWYAESGTVTSPPGPAVQDLELPAVAALPEKDVPGEVREGESVARLASAGSLWVQAMYEDEYAGNLWSAHKQLGWWVGQEGSTLSLTFDVPRDGRFRLDAYLTRSAFAGRVAVRVGGQSVGDPLDLWTETGPLPTEAISLGSFWLDSGPLTVTFEHLGASPANPAQGSFAELGVDCLSLVPDSPPRYLAPPRSPVDGIDGGGPPSPVELERSGFRAGRASS